MAVADRWIQDELKTLQDVLPPRVRIPLEAREDRQELLEVILDLGRPPEARFIDEEVMLDSREVDQEDLDYVVSRVGEFGGDNRAGIPRTLHRISAMRNRKGDIVGITCRVGRAVLGAVKVIEDLVLQGRSVLLLGRPGVGKTTMLREVARVLADDARKRVIIVDTSNEIAGDGDIPHPAIGHARRMQVAHPQLQHNVMIEAVENHMPEVIIIDEMGAELEAIAARTIAERGVQLIATAHGNTLDNLVMNPTLSDLVGGIQSVTLGDEEARRRGTQKTTLERKAPPTFDVVVEIQNWEKVAVHEDVSTVVDAWLRGYPIVPETRRLSDAGEVLKTREVGGVYIPAPPVVNGPSQNGPEDAYVHDSPGVMERSLRQGVKVFLFGVGRDKVEQAGRSLGIPTRVVNDLRAADVVLTTKSLYRRGSQLVRIAERAGKPIYVLRKNSGPQIQQLLRAVSGGDEEEEDAVGGALKEAEKAAERVRDGASSVELAPQRAYIRRLQHLLAEKYNVASTSSGQEPHRYVTFVKG